MSKLTVNVLTTAGIQPLDLDEQERSLAASHVNAVTQYRDFNRPEALDRFRGQTVRGLELETDLHELQRLARQGKLNFEDFYES